MSDRVSIPVLNMFNLAKMPLGSLTLDKDYAEKISSILKFDNDRIHSFMIGFISKGEGKNFEIIGCTIMPNLERGKK